MMQSQGGAGRRARGRGRWWRRLLLLPLGLVLLAVLQVAAVRFVDPPLSMFMAIRQADAWLDRKPDFRLVHQWRDLDAMAGCLPVALIAAEDQNFAVHSGFDLEAIRRARERNSRGGRLRGGSTISQQVAKNLFLWQGSSTASRWARKGLEAWYTVLIEMMWSKRRILEVYANVAEFGDGIYGAQAAARSFFGRDADRLGHAQCARLAAVLPSPRRYSAERPGPYVQRRTRDIERNMRQIGGTAYLQRLD